MKILIAVDGSAYTQRMLDYIAAHDEWLSARHAYDVIHVALPIPPHVAGIVGPPAVADHQHEQCEAVFASIRPFFIREQAPATYLARSGHAADVIARHATDGSFEMIIMGSRGNGDLFNLVLGSVATGVLAGCSTPVLLIR